MSLTIEHLIDEFFGFVAESDVSAFDIDHTIRYLAPSMPRDDRAALGVEALQSLLDQELVELGRVSTEGFEPYGSPSRVLEQLRQAWTTDEQAGLVFEGVLAPAGTSGGKRG